MFSKSLSSTFRQSFRRLSRSADFAFVFDIDGVLVRGSKPLPGAKPALELLGQNQVPFLLLTNGGGVTEKQRASFLSERIGVPLSPRQLVQSHTPMRSYIGQWNRVMVVGAPHDSARKCAIEYGFKDVLMPHDLVNATPGISPHHQYSKQFLDQFALSPSQVDLDKPVDAVLVFNDCRDMGTDIQVILDLLNSDNGKIGTKRPASASGPEPAIPIIFSNNDFLWAADYPLPRFGQGAIRMMVERLYKEQNNGAELRSKILGKPFVSQYEFAAKTLVEWSGGQRFRDIYMVGDNPASDIQGANRSAWKSLLLRTGVYTDGDDIPLDSRPSEGVFDDVLDAVRHVLNSQ